MRRFTFSDTLTGTASGLTAQTSAAFSVAPSFGFNADIDGGLPAAAAKLGVARLAGAKYFYRGVPAAPPAVPPGLVMPLFCLKPSLPIDAGGELALAAFFSRMKPGQMATVYQEGEHDGYTVAQITAAHQTAARVFDRSAPKGAKYIQVLMTWSASGRSGHGPLNQWVVKRGNGNPLDMYGLDCYPNTATSPPASVLDAALSELKLVVPKPVIGISECNYTTNLSSGITWTAGTQAEWLRQCWSWAAANNCLTFTAYFYTPNGVPWPPADPATITQLTAIAKAAGL